MRKLLEVIGLVLVIFIVSEVLYHVSLWFAVIVIPLALYSGVSLGMITGDIFFDVLTAVLTTIIATKALLKKEYVDENY